MLTDLSLSGNNINLNPASSSVTISSGSTLKVDNITQSTSTQPLTISSTNILKLSGNSVNLTASGTNQNINIITSGTGIVDIVSSSTTCTGNFNANGIQSITGVVTPGLRASSGNISVASQLNCNSGIAVSGISATGTNIPISSPTVFNSGA